MSTLLDIEHLSKVFPGQVALDDVSITLDAGRTRALVGQNGSGKSTLIKILAGYHQPSSGTATIHRGDAVEQFALGDGAAATAAGLRFVHQDLALVDSLSAAENLAIGGAGFATDRFGRIRWKVAEARAQQALAELGFDDFAVTVPIGALAPSQKTAVAVARALQGWEQGATLLVLDEPTASLPDADVERLFAAVRLLQARGVAILYVSHHLDEVFEIADDVTVLRDARHVTTTAVADLDRDKLIELMIGHRLQRSAAAARPSTGTEVLLRTEGLTGATITDLDLRVEAGEVVGVAGITGSGRDSIVPLISGQIPSADGRVIIDSGNVPTFAPAKGIAAGGAFLPADRATQGIFPLLAVTANVTISDLSRNTRRGRLLHRSERAETGTWVDSVGVRLASIESPISSLSGGNQQKILFARCLRLSPKVLVLDEPTHGVDVGAKEQIHVIVEQAAATGAAVLVASTDTDELVRLSHRVIVFRKGRVAVELVGDQITSEAILHAQSPAAHDGQPAA